MSDPKSNLDTNGLAQELVRLRYEGRQVPTAQFLMLPTDLQIAMETQSSVSKLEGVSSDAWKVAISPDNDFVVAPLHPYFENASGSVVQWRKGMKLEAEIAVKLDRDLPIRSEGSYSRDEIAAAVSAVYLGAELIWTGVEEGGKISFPLFLADRLGNMGYVLGPLLPTAMLDSSIGMPLQVSLDGRSLYDAGAQHPTGDVLTWLLGYANDRSRPQTVLVAGSIITTGSLCGAIEIANSGNIEIKLGSEAALDFVLSAKA